MLWTRIWSPPSEFYTTSSPSTKVKACNHGNCNQDNQDVKNTHDTETTWKTKRFSKLELDLGFFLCRKNEKLSFNHIWLPRALKTEIQLYSFLLSFVETILIRDLCGLPKFYFLLLRKNILCVTVTDISMWWFFIRPLTILVHFKVISNMLYQIYWITIGIPRLNWFSFFVFFTWPV